MATNFKIVCREKRNGVHMNLIGDFDGSSAHELINKLTEINGKSPKVTIHTNGLKTIHPFGVQIFQNHYRGLKTGKKRLMFAGCHSLMA